MELEFGLEYDRGKWQIYCQECDSIEKLREEQVTRKGIVQKYSRALRWSVFTRGLWDPREDGEPVLIDKAF